MQPTESTKIAIYLHDDQDKTHSPDHEGALYGSAREVREKLDSIVKWVSAWVWHILKCTVIFRASRDRQIPNKPLVFGKIEIFWDKADRSWVLHILETKFPKISEKT